MRECVWWSTSLLLDDPLGDFVHGADLDAEVLHVLLHEAELLRPALQASHRAGHGPHRLPQAAQEARALLLVRQQVLSGGGGGRQHTRASIRRRVDAEVTKVHNEVACVRADLRREEDLQVVAVRQDGVQGDLAEEALQGSPPGLDEVVVEALHHALHHKLLRQRLRTQRDKEAGLVAAAVRVAFH